MLISFLAWCVFHFPVISGTNNLLKLAVHEQSIKCSPVVYIHSFTVRFDVTEYGAGNIISTHGDIYSYGIIILEMVTGRRPTDNTFGHGLSLRKYVEMAINNRVMDIVNIELVTELENENARVDGAPNRKMLHSLISLLKLGLLCSEETPSSRMSTKDIIKELHAIRNALT